MQSKSETFFYTVTITIVTQLLCGVFVYHFVEDNRKVNHSNVMPREKFDEYLLTSLKVGRWRRELDAAMQSSLGLERHKRDEETSESPGKIKTYEYLNSISCFNHTIPFWGKKRM